MSTIYEFEVWPYMSSLDFWDPDPEAELNYDIANNRFQVRGCSSNITVLVRPDDDGDVTTRVIIADGNEEEIEKVKAEKTLLYEGEIHFLKQTAYLGNELGEVEFEVALPSADCWVEIYGAPYDISGDPKVQEPYLIDFVIRPL